MSETGEKIHLNRAGQSLGTFTAAEIHAGLLAGRYIGSDLGWKQGMESWRPLTAWPEFAGIGEIQTPPPIPVSLPGFTAFASQEIPESDRTAPAWERRETIGWLQAVGLSVKEVLLNPQATFDHMKREGGLTGPLLYYLITGLIGGIFSVAYNFVLNATGQRDLSQIPPALKPLFQNADLTPGYLIGVIFGVVVMAPLLLALGAFIGAGVTHLCLMLVGGARKPFEVTFRVVCYAWGSSRVLEIMPICGSLIGAAWGMVCSIIGLARAHETDTWRALVAVLLPLITCCGLIFAVMAALFAAFMPQLKQ